MKTVEEKIISHIEQNCTYPDGSPMMDEQTFYEGAKWGYNEVMRWRDPEVEQPKNGEPVIVKYMTARGAKKYGIAKYSKLGIGNPWIIEGSTGRDVIGWRPIE